MAFIITFTFKHSSNIDITPVILNRLGFTHLVAETLCVGTHRQLSPSHPLFRLLAPHFLYILAIST